MCSACQKIYTESTGKLHDQLNETQTKISVKVSLLVFHNIKPFYCLPSTEKEIQSYLCISCLKRHVFLKIHKQIQIVKEVNATQITQLKAEEKFDEMSAEKVCKL